MFSFSYSGTLKVLEYRNLYKLSIMIDNKTRVVLFIKRLPLKSRRQFPYQRCLRNLYWFFVIDNKARRVLYLRIIGVSPIILRYNTVPPRTLVHQRCWRTDN